MTESSVWPAAIATPRGPPNASPVCFIATSLAPAAWKPAVTFASPSVPVAPSLAAGPGI